MTGEVVDRRPAAGERGRGGGNRGDLLAGGQLGRCVGALAERELLLASV